MIGIKFLYYACFFLGFFYALISSVLSHFFDGGHDAGADAHPGDGGHGDSSLSVLSPTIVAAFISGFGGTGILITGLTQWSVLAGAMTSVAGGLFLAFAAFFLLGLLYSRTQGGSEYLTSELTGVDAEVITAIPENGFGEIAYSAKGTRANAPARSLDGRPIPKHSPVTIVKIVGATHYVKKLE